jgi:hypothetical protein
MGSCNSGGESVGLGRKGIFFTLIAVSLLGIVLFTYSVTYSYSLQERSAIIETRVDTMNRFLSSVDSDMKNAIYISGYRAIVGLSDYCTSNGSYVSSANVSLKEIFLNGSLGSDDLSVMENNTFPDWIGKIRDKGSEIGINLTLNVTSVSVYQPDPWNVRFDVIVLLNLSDSKATATWIKSKSISSDISIIGFEDIQYALHTNGQVWKRINITPYDGNFTSGNDTSNLKEHMAKTYYIAFNASPSFLMRFENNFNASPYGIESLVNKTEVLDYCSSIISSVDSLCWQKSSVAAWSVVGLNGTGFKIDNQTNPSGTGRIARYDLEDVIY